MSADRILLWMSARGEGSWQQFRSAVEELHVGDDFNEGLSKSPDDSADPVALPLYQSLRLNLQRLGHAEFFKGAGTRDWRVTPPAIAATQSAGQSVGILAGARSRRLLQRLHEVSEPSSVDITSGANAPDRIRVVGESVATLRTVAAKAGLLFQHDASAAILAAVPPVDDLALRKRAEMPFGRDWNVEEFVVPDLRWRASTRDAAARASLGLFRFGLRHQRYVFLCNKGVVFEVPIQVGKYLVLKRGHRRVIQYDPTTQLLSVPATCRPPLLVERALVLCSGSLPLEAERGPVLMLTYSHVPPSIARLASTLVQQVIV